MFRREACQLLPIAEADLPRVLEWRNSPRIRANMYTDHLISWPEHLAWFARVARQSPSRFLVFWLSGHPVGVVHFSEPDREGTSHWGFYLGAEDAPRGSGSAMGTLALDYAFGTLGVAAVVGEAFRFNEASVAYHLRLGFRETAGLARVVPKGGRAEQVAGFLLTREAWQRVKPLLEGKCFENGGSA